MYWETMRQNRRQSERARATRRTVPFISAFDDVYGRSCLDILYTGDLSAPPNPASWARHSTSLERFNVSWNHRNRSPFVLTHFQRRQMVPLPMECFNAFC